MAVSSSQIRVLIVDDIPETRENVRKLLAFESDIEVVGVAGTGHDAISAAREFQPDIVLMDINMPGLDGISAVEAITQEVPNVQVIMMSVQSETDYVRRSMLAGARDFLIKPFTSDELVSTIRRVNKMGQQRAAAMPQPQMMQVVGPSGKRMSVPMTAAPPMPEGSVIVVFGPKGGVGTSTLAVNLAVALQKPDVKVALIDASLQFGNVDVLLNLHANRSIADIAQTINDLDADLVTTVISPHPSGIKALLAPTRPELADLVQPDHLQRIVEQMRDMFDYIVVDTAATLSDMTLTTFDVADRIVLVTVADVPAIKNTRTFFQVTEALGYPSSKVVLVLNQMDPRNPITPKMIEENLKHKVALAVPYDAETVANSIRRGLPFVTEQRARPIANAVIQLSDKLVSELRPVPESAEEAVAEDTPRKRGTRFFRQ
jgi:pilus assembly protein CpaE